jgi:phenylacetate-CoA ligase
VSAAAEFPFGDWQTLVGVFARAAERSAFVRTQIARSGTSLADLTSEPAAWRRLSPTEKQHLIADQEQHPPFGERLCIPNGDIGLIVESSGSTGRGREVHYTSRSDTQEIAERWGGYLSKLDVGRDDVVALAFPIGMAGGGVRHWSAYVAAGANVLRIGTLSSVRKLEAIRYYRASTLVATPAYVDHLAIVAEESGIKPADVGIRRIVVATQSVSVDWIRSAEEAWGAKLFEWYATSAGFAAFACAEGMLRSDGERGTLHWDPTLNVHEIIDPATGEWTAHDHRGEVVGTPLAGEAEALFRMRSGDEVRFREPGSCICGSPWPGIESGTVRRLDDMLKVKGINLYPPVVDATVLDIRGVLDYRARVLADERRRERVELDVLAHVPEPDALRDQIASSLHEGTGVSFEVTVIGDAATWSQESSGEAGKVKRWLDQRAQAERTT